MDAPLPGPFDDFGDSPALRLADRLCFDNSDGIADMRIVEALDILRAVLAERLQNQAGLIETFKSESRDHS